MLFSKPCSKCPYKLEIVETLVNPCPQCGLQNNKLVDIFTNILNKGQAIYRCLNKAEEIDKSGKSKWIVNYIDMK